MHHVTALCLYVLAPGCTCISRWFVRESSLCCFPREQDRVAGVMSWDNELRVKRPVFCFCFGGVGVGWGGGRGEDGVVVEGGGGLPSPYHHNFCPPSPPLPHIFFLCCRYYHDCDPFCRYLRSPFLPFPILNTVQFRIRCYLFREISYVVPQHNCKIAHMIKKIKRSTLLKRTQ